MSLLTIFQSYRDLEAGDTLSLKFKRRDQESNPGSLVFKLSELNHSTIATPIVVCGCPATITIRYTTVGCGYPVTSLSSRRVAAMLHFVFSLPLFTCNDRGLLLPCDNHSRGRLMLVHYYVSLRLRLTIAISSLGLRISSSLGRRVARGLRNTRLLVIWVGLAVGGWWRAVSGWWWLTVRGRWLGGLNVIMKATVWCTALFQVKI